MTEAPSPHSFWWMVNLNLAATVCCASFLAEACIHSANDYLWRTCKFGALQQVPPVLSPSDLSLWEIGTCNDNDYHYRYTFRRYQCRYVSPTYRWAPAPKSLTRLKWKKATAEIDPYGLNPWNGVRSGTGCAFGRSDGNPAAGIFVISAPC